MFTGIDFLILAAALIGFGYVLAAEGEKADKRAKVIMNKEVEKRNKAQQEINRLRGEAIAERNRREYDLIARDDKQDFIEQLINQ